MLSDENLADPHDLLDRLIDTNVYLSTAVIVLAREAGVGNASPLLHVAQLGLQEMPSACDELLSVLAGRLELVSEITVYSIESRD